MKKLLFVLVTSVLIVMLAFPMAAASHGTVDLPGEYEDLRRIIPTGAYAGEMVTFDNLPYTDLASNYQKILINKLVHDGVIVRPEKEDSSYNPENNPNAPKIQLETVKKAFEEIFGPGSFDKLNNTERFTNYTDNLIYDADSNSYVYTCYNWGGGDPAVSVYSRYVNVESSAEEVCIYEIFAMYGDYQEKCLFADTGRLAYKDGILLWKGASGKTLLAKLVAGELDEYLPVYKHTFKDNGQGGYYWHSTEVSKEWVLIPDGLFANEDVSTEGVPATGESTQGNRTILGGNWGNTSSQSTVSDTDVETPEPKGTNTVGIICGCGSAIIVITVVIILIVKKQKRNCQ